MGNLSADATQELLQAVSARYQSAAPETKRHILDEFIAVTGYRMLFPVREAAGRRHRRKVIPAVRQTIPVRTFADWKDPVPGFLEMDLVAHSGETMAGSFAHTLVLTDIAGGWTESVALIVRESSLIVEALEQLRMYLPFPMRGVDVTRRVDPGFKRQIVSGINQTSGVEPSVPVLL